MVERPQKHADLCIYAHQNLGTMTATAEGDDDGVVIVYRVAKACFEERDSSDSFLAGDVLTWLGLFLLCIGIDWLS